MNTNIEIIRKCENFISQMIESKNHELEIINLGGRENLIAAAALEVMEVVERKKFNVLKLNAIVESRDNARDVLRKNFEALRDHDVSNFEMLCLGKETYVENDYIPTEAKWLADRVDSCDQFIGLAIERACKSMDSGESLAVIDADE